MYLSGGLGNQLFQASAARKLNLMQEVILLPNLGKAVAGPDGTPEIAEFNLEDFAIQIDQRKFSHFQIYLARQILMMSSVTSKHVLKSSIANFLKRVNQFLLGILIGERIQSPQGVGFDSSFQLKPSTTLLIGNFHSYLWVDEDFKKSLKLKKSRSTLYSAMESEAKMEAPIGIHVRLGDYLSIDELNVLNTWYYSNALEKCRNLGLLGTSWIFTNEPTRLCEYLSADFISNSRIVDLNISSAETLELLRNCSAVVTANSTFSWWGAYSTHRIHPTILTPEKWFRTKLNPVEMVPASWIRVPNE